MVEHLNVSVICARDGEDVSVAFGCFFDTYRKISTLIEVALNGEGDGGRMEGRKLIYKSICIKRKRG